MEKEFGTKLRNPVKFDRARKVWYLFLLFFFFFDYYCQTLISWREAGRYAMSTPKFGIFLITLNFQRSSLKLFGNLWGNSYTKFAILDIKFHFTCGSSDLYQNMAKFQNIFGKDCLKILLLLSALSIIQIFGKSNHLTQKC